MISGQLVVLHCLLLVLINALSERERERERERKRERPTRDRIERAERFVPVKISTVSSCFLRTAAAYTEAVFKYIYSTRTHSHTHNSTPHTTHTHAHTHTYTHTSHHTPHTTHRKNMCQIRRGGWGAGEGGGGEEGGGGGGGRTGDSSNRPARLLSETLARYSEPLSPIAAYRSFGVSVFVEKQQNSR